MVLGTRNLKHWVLGPFGYNALSSVLGTSQASARYAGLVGQEAKGQPGEVRTNSTVEAKNTRRYFCQIMYLLI